jgi:hypothetical protein
MIRMVAWMSVVTLILAGCSANTAEDPSDDSLTTTTRLIAASTTQVPTTTIPPTSTTTQPASPSADELVEAINVWMSERDSFTVEVSRSTLSETGERVGLSEYAGEGTFDGGYGADSIWWSFSTFVLTIPPDDDEGLPMQLIVASSDIEVDEVAYTRDWTDGLWSVDNDHDHSGHPMRAMVQGELVMTETDVAIDDTSSDSVFVLRGGFPPNPDIELAVWAASSGEVLRIEETTSDSSMDLWFGDLLPDEIGDLTTVKATTIVTVDRTLPAVIAPPLTNMGVGVGRVVDIAAEFPSSDGWGAVQDLSAETAFFWSSDEVAVALVEIDQPGIEMSELLALRFASLPSPTVSYLDDAVTLQGDPIATATITLDDDPTFAMNELYYVDATGGAILTVFTPGDAGAEYYELIAYIRQSLRTVPSDVADQMRSADATL